MVSGQLGSTLGPLLVEDCSSVLSPNVRSSQDLEWVGDGEEETAKLYGLPKFTARDLRRRLRKTRKMVMSPRTASRIAPKDAAAIIAELERLLTDDFTE